MHVCSLFTELEVTKPGGPTSYSELSDQSDQDNSDDEERSQKYMKKRKGADKKKKKTKMQDDEEHISGVDDPAEKDWIDELPISKKRKNSKKRREKRLE
jgi:hypothetical protein